MRGCLVLAGLAAACTPEVTSGAYLCGANASCPEDQVCNGLDNTCVLPLFVEPFRCEPEVNSEPDDTPGTARSLSLLDCVSAPVSLDSCLFEADSEDWVTFDTPAVCASVGVSASISFPVAWAQLELQLWDVAADELLASDGECANRTGQAGDQLRCLEQALLPGRRYALRVLRTGEGDCGGSCTYNRYTLGLQLQPPR